MTAVLEAKTMESDVSRFERHMGQSPLGFIYINSDGTVEYMNQRAANIIGFERNSETFGLTVTELEKTIGCGIPDCFEYIRTGNSLDIADHHFLNRQNQFKAVNIYSNSLYTGEGTSKGAFAIIQDVTDASREKTRLVKADYILSLIAQISDAVSSTADLEDVLRVILIGVTARQGLGFNRAFLFLVDSDKRSLEGAMGIGPASPEEAEKIWSGLENKHKTLLELLNDHLMNENSAHQHLNNMIKGWSIPLAEAGIMRVALEEGKGINVTGRDGVDKDSDAVLERLRSDYLVVAPIISRGKWLGVILADNRITGQPINDYMVDLLQTFANHTALAIERSQLYDKIMERAAELEEKNRLLAQSQEQIIRAEKMSVIGELTSSIAHELRNPLTVIGGFANMMLTAGDAGPNTEYLNIIMAETKRAESAIHQVLDFSKASKSASRLIEFNFLIHQTFDLLLSKLKFGQKKPSLNIADSPASVWGNPDQLIHALLQFMLIPVEEITGEYRVVITNDISDNRVRMKISFTGRQDKREKLVKTLGQIFGSATGAQKLTMIVAGETIRCHGGNYGIEGSKDDFPSIYVELPPAERGNNGQNSDS